MADLNNTLIHGSLRVADKTYTKDLNSDVINVKNLNSSGNIQITTQNDSIGIYPATDNWNTIGASDKRFAYGYFNVLTSDSLTNKGNIITKGQIMSDTYHKFGTNTPAVIFDKPGTNLTGIGSNGEANTIYFGATSWQSDHYIWDHATLQNWKFNGSIMLKGPIYYYDETDNIQEPMIQFIKGNANGSGIQIGSGGTVLIGAGESGNTYKSGKNLFGGDESVHITADDNIIFASNLQNNYTSRKEMIFNKDGVLTLPSDLSFPTNNNGYSAKVSYTDNMLWMKTQGKKIKVSDTVGNSPNTYTFPNTDGTVALTSDIPTNHVTTDTDQTITGPKTFTNRIYVTGIGENRNMPYFLGSEPNSTGGEMKWVSKADATVGHVENDGVSTSYYNGRDNAIVKMKSVNGYSPMASLKTPTGSWELSTYNDENLWFVHNNDSNYNADDNNDYHIVKIPNKDGIVALTSDITDQVNNYVKKSGDAMSGSLTVLKNLYIGTEISNSRELSQAPENLTFNDFSRRASGLSNAVIYSGAGDWYFGADLKPEEFDIRSSFYGSGGTDDSYSSSLKYTIGNSTLYTLFNWKYGSGFEVDPTLITSSTPLIIQIKHKKQLYTDVLRLVLTGHDLIDLSNNYSGFLNSYTIEICNNYTNNTWIKVVDRQNVQDSIGKGLFYSLQLSGYTEIYGIRLKVTKASVTGNGYKYIKISTIQCRDFRPAFSVPESLGTVSQLGGEFLGNVNFKGDLTYKNQEVASRDWVQESAKAHAAISSDILSGFTLKMDSISWGKLNNSSYAYVTRLDSPHGGSIAFAEKDDKLSMQIDGDIFVHEGNDKVATINDLTNKYDTSGGKINGSVEIANNLTVGGDLIVNGNNTTINTSTLAVEDELIEVAKAANGLTNLAGLVVPKYNSTKASAAGLLFNNEGKAYIGTIANYTSGQHVTSTTGLSEVLTMSNYDNADGTVSNTTGTPSVAITKNSKNGLHFAFSNIKGDKGNDGAAAIISDGSTASVNNSSGVPSVKITTKGTNQNRTFDFAFSNLKGDKGNTGDKYIYKVYETAQTWPASGCKDYSERSSNVSWSNGHIKNGSADWAANIGKKILFIIHCDNGDDYITFQTISGAESLKPENVYWISKKGNPGQNGTNGSQGWGFCTNVNRAGFAQSWWDTYCITGKNTTWSATSNIRNGCRKGDLFTVSGTTTDTGRGYLAIFRSTNDSGELNGDCLGSFYSEKGSKGNDGVSVSSISKTGTSGLVDTYTIKYSNNNTSTFNVTNGQNGAAAGFGTPTYNNDLANNSNGAAKVTVTASGPNTAKVFNFKFENLKGEKGDSIKGDTGSVADVIDTSSGEYVSDITLDKSTKNLTVSRGSLSNYALKSSLNDYVTLRTTQTIEGQKTFSKRDVHNDGIAISSGSSKKANMIFDSTNECIKFTFE